jgi:DNA-binding MarR family transcriptional regulator
MLVYNCVTVSRNTVIPLTIISNMAVTVERRIYHPHRIRIMSILSSKLKVSFRQLKDDPYLSDLSDSNLVRHLQLLEQRGLIMYHREINGRKTSTFYSITPKGSRIFDLILETMKI